MTWHWLTCFSLFLVATPLPAASVRGSVIVTGDRGEPLRDDLSGAVVWLQATADSVAVHPPPAHFRIIQKNKQFTPHVLAIPVGATVEFPNFDPIFHNAFSNYNGQIFDVGLYPPGSSRTVAFRRAGVVRVFCNIHSSMSAVIVVLPSTLYAQSKTDGTFVIDNVLPGTYHLQFFYERATERTLAALARSIDVTASAFQTGPVSISEAGYLLVPHLNKYGKPYGPISDTNTYPGARP